MKRKLESLVAVVLMAVAGAVSAGEIEVMTQNQYLGADLTPIIAAGSAEPFDAVAFNAAVIEALTIVAANLPEQRLEALGALISKRKPHLVGLQEVFSYECSGPGCSYQAIAGAFTDHLQGTLDALDGSYSAAAIVKNLDITLTIATPVGLAEVTVIDRDVILARSDIAPAVTPVDYGATCGHPSVNGCNYDLVGVVELAGVPVRIERGFVGVDLSLDGEDYRFVNTHLEVREPEADNPYSRIVQSAQAYQLVVTALTTLPEGRSLIVVGDINSDPRDTELPVPPPLQSLLGVEAITPPYMQFARALFTDVWTMRPGTYQGRGAPLVGFSCCQWEDLSNHKSDHYERIDMIFSLRQPTKVLDARLLGESIADKTSPKGWGVWPSDHASVAARIQY